MSRPINVLVEEHRLIEQVLGWVLTGAELDQMETAFEARLKTEGAEEGLRGLADRLTAAFAPDAGRMAAAAAGPACGFPPAR